MRRIPALVVLVVSLICGFTTSARADTWTYTYTSQPFNVWFGGDSCSGGVGECRLSATFTLVSPLGPSLTDFNVTPLTWDFSDGVNTLTQANSSAINFTFWTDSGANIIAWNFGVTDPTYYSPTEYLNLSSGYSYPPGSGGQDTSCSINGINGPYCATQFTGPGLPGTWSVVETPEPSSLLLLGGSILSLLALATRVGRHGPLTLL